MTIAAAPQKPGSDASGLVARTRRRRGLIEWKSALLDARQYVEHPALSEAQNFLLKRRLIQALAVRAGYWLVVLLVANVLTILYAKHNPNPPHGFSVAVWSTGVWVLGIFPYLCLFLSTINLREDCSVNDLR